MNPALILNPPFVLKCNLSLKWKLILRICWTLLIISQIVLLIIYIFQVNSLTRQNYLLQAQKIKLAEMQKEKEILEINFSQANSLANVENYFQNQNFEKVNQVKYIKMLDNTIAGLSRNE